MQLHAMLCLPRLLQRIDYCVAHNLIMHWTRHKQTIHVNYFQNRMQRFNHGVNKSVNILAQSSIKNVIEQTRKSAQECQRK